MFTFLKSFLRHPKEVGALFPTSSSYSQLACQQVDWSGVRNIVEIGAGDGAVTQYIAKRLTADQRLFVFEIDSELFKQLAERVQQPNVILIPESAEDIASHLAKYGVEKVEVVFSEVPLVNLPKKVGDAILQSVKAVLPKGGLFLQIQYSLLTLKKLRALFSSVEVKFTLWNLPPAFLYICKV